GQGKKNLRDWDWFIERQISVVDTRLGSRYAHQFIFGGVFSLQPWLLIKRLIKIHFDDDFCLNFNGMWKKEYCIVYLIIYIILLIMLPLIPFKDNCLALKVGLYDTTMGEMSLSMILTLLCGQRKTIEMHLGQVSGDTLKVGLYDTAMGEMSLSDKIPVHVIRSQEIAITNCEEGRKKQIMVKTCCLSYRGHVYHKVDAIAVILMAMQT
ncbi:hypothetical protein ACJX0J_025968, partial [Zea mays]